MKCKNTSHEHVTECEALKCGYEREIERLKTKLTVLENMLKRKLLATIEHDIKNLRRMKDEN